MLKTIMMATHTNDVYVMARAETEKKLVFPLALLERLLTVYPV